MPGSLLRFTPVAPLQVAAANVPLSSFLVKFPLVQMRRRRILLTCSGRRWPTPLPSVGNERC